MAKGGGQQQMSAPTVDAPEVGPITRTPEGRSTAYFKVQFRTEGHVPRISQQITYQFEVNKRPYPSEDSPQRRIDARGLAFQTLEWDGVNATISIRFWWQSGQRIETDVVEFGEFGSAASGSAAFEKLTGQEAEELIREARVESLSPGRRAARWLFGGRR